MTSGSRWTHLIVTRSTALVDELEERVALARVACEASVPLVLGDGVVDRGVRRRRQAGCDSACDRRAEPLAQVDQVIERDALAAVHRRRPVGVFAGGRRVIRRDRVRDALREQLGIVEPLAKTDLVVAVTERGIPLDRDGEGSSGELGDVVADASRDVRQRGAGGARRQARAWVTHARESSARPGAAPRAGHAGDAARMRGVTDPPRTPDPDQPQPVAGERRLARAPSERYGTTPAAGGHSFDPPRDAE